MLKKLGAWSEILKLGMNVRKRSEELRNYYRALSVNSLRREGWFDYLATPRSLDELANHFGYVDLDFVSKYLEAYAEDGILIKEGDKYRTNGTIGEFPVKPLDVFGPGLIQLTTDAANNIPLRMKGTYVTFHDEMNVFNWDDALNLKMYDAIRKAAFRFTDALNRRGKFIDVGCGSGVGTAAIWGYYYKRRAFDSGNPVQIYALEHDPNLKQIAEEEFVMYVSRLHNIDREVVESLEEHHPTFVQGSAEELPFEDEFFDMVYTSQVIHWCDAEKATKEMMRVLKPGGLFFGTEVFYPMMDKYTELYILLNEGAYGAIKKEDFFRWVKESGATHVETVTPAGVFRVLK